MRVRVRVGVRARLRRSGLKRRLPSSGLVRRPSGRPCAPSLQPHAPSLHPCIAAQAFLETKLRASQCGLLDAIRNHVGGGAHRHGPGGEVSSVNSVAVGQQAARGPVGVGRRQPRGEHAAAPELAAPSWPSSLSYREQPRAPALAALAAMASCGEGEPGGPRAPEGAELHGAPAEAVSSDGGVEHTGAGALEVDSSA